MSAYVNIVDDPQTKAPDGMLGSAISPLLAKYKDPKYFQRFRELNLQLSKQDVRASVTWDIHLLQSVRLMDDIVKVCNTLVKRLRDWYEYCAPEVSRRISDHESFVKMILSKSPEQLRQELGITETMGADFSSSDMNSILSLARRIEGLYEERHVQEDYIRLLMEQHCPNVLAVAGVNIGSRLIELSGSFDHFAKMPGSTVQLLGAEKALFRHIKSGAKCPKYGVLLNHALVNAQPMKNKGKAARTIADKVAVAAKVDLFKGEFMGDELNRQIEKRLGDLQ